MWTTDQQNRLAVEHQILQREGFTQFGVYYHKAHDTYSASGTATSSSGRQYYLYSPIPSGFPAQRPPLYVTDPNPLRMFDGTALSQLGLSHAMHTQEAHSAGWVQICHWRSDRWHSGIVLQKVFLKALVWVEAYEQHLATGRGIADFVRSMQEAA